MFDNLRKNRAQRYYDKFSYVYDMISPKMYYHKARKEAVRSLGLQEGQTVLNVPVGTGQNFDYFQDYLHGTGQIIGADLSEGMLAKAFKKAKGQKHYNVRLIQANVAELDLTWLAEYQNKHPDFKVDAILCDLGLSGFDEWQNVIDNLLNILEPKGRLTVMDWQIKEPCLRGEFIKWIGGGEVNRPIPAYLESRLHDYQLDHSFNRGGVFVASGFKPKNARR
jgi:ubiquinone/menaquinone biosynthesis C-methylase UbiE